ncbi:zinc finger protein 287-like [Aricia agestis]|uniref:zinc finger protein 287-like n=1 Tax=Aricia agestis TaxID=91739 RepID=UPI001C208BA9|nr:zinc finger protein 287-like [Aricia agestis]
MEEIKRCRCCLVSGFHKDLYAAYTCSDQKEIYSDMLQECFNIKLNRQQECNGICEACIATLRESLRFKHLVLRSEQELSQTVNDIMQIDEKAEIKIEPKFENDSDESDDYFLADAVSVKNEYESLKKRTNKRKKISKEADWTPKEAKITAKGISLKSRDGSTKQKKVKSDKIILKSDLKFNVTLTTRYNNEKKKHRENLLTVLKYTNATPFKNKSLLGYICGYCNNTYPDPIDLRRHTEDEHKRDRLDLRTTTDMSEYYVKLDVTDLTCMLCNEKFSNLSFFADHLVRVHDKVYHVDIKDHLMQFKLKKGDVYDCAMCSSKYETFKMLKQHMNKHYSNYSCDKCETSFATKRSLNSHQATHEEGSFKCDHCDKVFSSKMKKQYHKKTKHLGARNISNCPYCNEPFRSYYQRNQHLVKVHNSEAQYKCNICNKGYILKSLLMCHIKKNHLMERNCQCTECGYRFFSKKALKAHMIKHSGERKYTCEVCHKAYARKYTLREHMRIHNNDRRFKCEVCSTAFVQKCSLKSHLLSHHGISLAASDITSM